MKGNEGFYFSNFSGKHYDLIADDSLLSGHSGWAPGTSVCVRGALSSDASAIHVTSISDLPERVVKLNPSIGPPSTWLEHTNKPYGLSFRLPESFLVTKDHGDEQYQDQYIQSNFAIKNGEIVVGKFTINGNSFSVPPIPQCDTDSRVFDGRLDLFVNPEIHKDRACYQFDDYQPKHSALFTFHGIKFSENSVVSVGTGTSYTYDYYHTFQNGLCYEFVFSYVGYGARADDDPCVCAIPVISRRERRPRIRFGYEVLKDKVLSEFSFTKGGSAPRP